MYYIRRLEENKCRSFQEGEEPESYKLITLSLIPGKVMEHLSLEAIYRHIKEKK